MARKHAQEERKDRYFALHHYMLKTDAWRALSAPARAVYIQIGFRYDGFNNGRIAFSVRDAASECGLAKDTANRSFKELVDLGFIEETRHGGLSRKTRIASEWRMTAFKCDLTGAFKSVLFCSGESSRAAIAYPAAGPRLVAGNRPTCLKRRPSLSQTTVASVLNDGTACPKRRSMTRPSVPNDAQSRLFLGSACPKRRYTYSIARRRGTEMAQGGRPEVGEGKS
jgi:hypothetical protein